MIKRLRGGIEDMRKEEELKEEWNGRMRTNVDECGLVEIGERAATDGMQV
jgi:hypothetical protein